MDDMGEYVVKAVNSFGSKEASAFLSVERKFKELYISDFNTFTVAL